MNNSKFKATVNNTFNFNLTPQNLKEASLSKIKNGKIIFNFKGQNHLIELTKSNFNKKTYSFIIQGNSYEVQLSNELDIQIAEMGFAKGNSKKLNSIIAPMPGLVLSIHTKEGDLVKEGDVLLVLEAMKMENSIVATKDGTVSSISVTKGTTVEKGAHLIELT
jgi:biotin carboxyl carrier protein